MLYPSHQFEYRLTVCPELSLGVFLTVVPPKKEEDASSSSPTTNNTKNALHTIETLPYARPVETDRADGAVSVLLAHVVSTRCRGDVVGDKDMGVPAGWRRRKGKGKKGGGEDKVEGVEKEGKNEKKEEEEEKEEEVGHCEGGKTVGLHSLAVLPRLQRCGIGQMVVKAYLDQMRNCGLVERVALICQDVSSFFFTPTPGETGK